MDYHLVVVQPFGKYERGHVITTDEEAAAVFADHEHRLVRINIPSPPLPEPEAATTDEEKPAKRAIPRQA